MHKKYDQNVIISGHQARLQPTLDLHKRVWEETDPAKLLAYVLADTLFMMDDLGLRHADIVNAAKKIYDSTVANVAKCSI